MSRRCAVNEASFGRAAEATIVDSIRAACPDAVSLVAVDGNQIIGYMLFSPVVISGTARYRDEFEQAT
jgi:predicted N-acetyltransferase YhbS